jgi:PadR family transcriptional regulator, regulatory protein PadR
MGDEPRMTLQTLLVLKLLRDAPPEGCYGLEISKGTGLPTGSIYPILARLEQAGWLVSAWEDIDEVSEGRRRRRYYRLTTAGAERAKATLEDAQHSLAPTHGAASRRLRPGRAPA